VFDEREDGDVEKQNDQENGDEYFGGAHTKR
jgi:hypothetical protein